MNPTRRRIWDDDRFRAHTSSAGAFYDVARTLIEREAAVLVTPAPNYIAIASFVCALLGLIPFWIGFALCVLAIALGIGALWKGPQGRGRGFAIAGELAYE